MRLAILSLVLVVLAWPAGAQSSWPASKVAMDSGNTLQEDVDSGDIGGGGASAAGSDTQVQYNDGGSDFGGASALTYDDTVSDRGWTTIASSDDIHIGDADEGIISLGTAYIGQADETITGTVLDDILAIFNTTDTASDISYMFVGASNVPRFVIAEEGDDLATYNPRSMLIGHAATLANVDENIQCSTNYSAIDCITGGSGADLGVQDDVEVGGVLWIAEQADADADVATMGQVWVKNEAPNELWFTDDAGTDVKVSRSVNAYGVSGDRVVQSYIDTDYFAGTIERTMIKWWNSTGDSNAPDKHYTYSNGGSGKWYFADVAVAPIAGGTLRGDVLTVNMYAANTTDDENECDLVVATMEDPSSQATFNDQTTTMEAAFTACTGTIEVGFGSSNSGGAGDTAVTGAGHKYMMPLTDCTCVSDDCVLFVFLLDRSAATCDEMEGLHIALHVSELQ